MAAVKKTISLPKPLFDFAIRESRALSKAKKGDDKACLSLFVAELIENARQRKKAA